MADKRTKRKSRVPVVQSKKNKQRTLPRLNGSVDLNRIPPLGMELPFPVFDSRKKTLRRRH